MSYRIGNGFDFHKFQHPKQRPFILGGIELDSDFSIEAHSDGDVLLHSIADGMLGSLALGDIGDYFPDTSVECKNMDSKIILEKSKNLIKENLYKIENIDATIISQKPKISIYRNEIRKSISTLLDLDISQVSLKATTMEKCGAIGREEGICAISNVLVQKYK